MTPHDVIRSTAEHIRRVGTLMANFAHAISVRAINHDASKWSEEEYPVFETNTPRLRALTYGSPEYDQALAEIQPALKHHYAENSHHPEFHPLGVKSMTVLDLMEMLCDWKAAGERHADGSMARSLATNVTRFHIEPALFRVLVNTAYSVQWITQGEAEKLLRDHT